MGTPDISLQVLCSGFGLGGLCINLALIQKAIHGDQWPNSMQETSLTSSPVATELFARTIQVRNAYISSGHRHNVHRYLTSHRHSWHCVAAADLFSQSNPITTNQCPPKLFVKPEQERSLAFVGGFSFRERGAFVFVGARRDFAPDPITVSTSY